MCRIPWRDNHEVALYSRQNIKERILKNSKTMSSSFEPKQRIPLKITELEQPSKDGHPVKTTNYLQGIVPKCFPLY